MSANPAFLTPDEVRRLTKAKPKRLQVERLRERGYREGVHFILAHDGEPLVLRDKLDADGKPAQRSGPRWDRIGGVRQIRP